MPLQSTTLQVSLSSERPSLMILSFEIHTTPILAASQNLKIFKPILSVLSEKIQHQLFSVLISISSSRPRGMNDTYSHQY